MGIQVGWQVLPGPRSHRAVIRRKPTAKLCKHKATQSPLHGDGQTRLLCATKGLQSWDLTLQMCSPKMPLKSKIRPIWRSFLQAAWWVPASGLPTSHSSRTRASERNPEAITNLEHLFMQLIFLKGKKAKNNNNLKKTVNNSWMCVVQSTSDVSLLRHPSLGPTPSPSTVEPPRGTSPVGSRSWMLPAFGVTFSAYRQNRSNLAFFSGFNFFLFFGCFVFIKKKKKAPLQSVIPINIIHLKNSIYIFIYIFLYIFVCTGCPCLMSYEHLSRSWRSVGFYSTLISKSAFQKRCPKNPETSSKEIPKKKKSHF